MFNKEIGCCESCMYPVVPHRTASGHAVTCSVEIEHFDRLMSMIRHDGQVDPDFEFPLDDPEVKRKKDEIYSPLNEDWPNRIGPWNVILPEKQHEEKRQ